METMLFKITEDALTSAIFYRSSLDTEGSGSKADARAQARLMLAAPKLLSACKALLSVVDACALGVTLTPPDGFAKNIRAAASAAISAVQRHEE